MIRTLLAALVFLVPAAAIADSQLDRMEALAEDMNLGMAKMMVREITAAGGDPAPLMAALPDTKWDDEYRAAGRCLLDKYTQAAGPAAVDLMLDQMEAMIPKLETATMESMGDDAMDIQPAGVTQEQSIEFTQSCGMIEQALRRMQESGFSAAMTQAYQSINNN
jgi:hypothetical protein